MKKVKKYQPVQIKNPTTDGYSIRLQSGQCCQLILQKSNQNEIFDVEINSDLLVIEEVFYDYENLKETYIISQKLDLEKWSYISTVFLGNVIIKYKSKKNKEESIIRACVFMNCKSLAKQNVVAVINPDNNLVKIEAVQILQVVLYNPKLLSWGLIGVEKLGMVCARSETVYNDVFDVYDKTALLCQEPRNVPTPVNANLTNAYECIKTHYENNKIVEGLKECHFWLHLGVSALRKACTEPNGNYPLGELSFIGRTDNGEPSTRNMEVIVSLRGNQSRIVNDYQVIRKNIHQWNARYLDQNSILFPGFNESIDINNDNDSFYVEITQPSVYFNEARDSDCRWIPDFNLDSRTGLKVKELPPRHVDSKIIQRFLISNMLTAKPPNNLMFIGVVRFICRNAKFIFSYKNIALSFWKTPKALVGYSSNNNVAHTVKYDLCKNNQQSYDFKTKIELEQIKIVDLKENAKCMLLKDIDSKTSIVSDLYSYYDDDLMYCGDQRQNYKQHQKKIGFLGGGTKRIDPDLDCANDWNNWADLV